MPLAGGCSPTRSSRDHSAIDLFTSNQTAALRERAAGWALALYLIAGTWSLARVTGIEPTLIAQPRSWAVAALLLLAASPGRSRSERAPGMLGAELVWLGFTLLAATWSPDLELAEVDAIDVGLLVCVAVCVHRLARSGDVEALVASLRSGLLVVLLLLAAVALVAGVGGGRLAVLGGGPNVFGRNMGLLCVLALDAALRGDIGRARVPAARGAIPHATSLGLSAAGFVAETCSGPTTAVFRLRASDENPGARSREGLRHGLLGWAVVSTLAVALVALSGSRGAMIATAVAAEARLLLGDGKIARRVTVVACVAALGIAGLLFTPIGARVIESFAERVLDLLLTDGYVSGRDRVYAVALERGAERPVFGHGLASFAAHTPWPYAHNIVLDAWFETGAVGVALLGLLLGRVALGVRRVGARGRELWLSAAVLVLVAAQFSGGRYDARGFLLFASLCLALPRAPSRGGAA